MTPASERERGVGALDDACVSLRVCATVRAHKGDAPELLTALSIEYPHLTIVQFMSAMAWAVVELQEELRAAEKAIAP